MLQDRVMEDLSLEVIYTGDTEGMRLTQRLTKKGDDRSPNHLHEDLHILLEAAMRSLCTTFPSFLNHAGIHGYEVVMHEGDKPVLWDAWKERMYEIRLKLYKEKHGPSAREVRAFALKTYRERLERGEKVEFVYEGRNYNMQLCGPSK